MLSISRTLAVFCLAGASLAQAAVGLTEVPGLPGENPVTVYYPSGSPMRLVPRGKFQLELAVDGVPVRANGRLVVISHGSGGSPWVHANLARRLVEAGFVVAMPLHKGDNYQDNGNPGPDSWSMRPAEVSHAIDAMAADARFAPLLDTAKVGVYGFSAGGHTALSMAGGRWSPAGFMRHCEQNLADDFQSCVGLITQLSGGPLDGAKKWLASWVIRSRFDDDRPREHHDPRVAAVVAGMPSAADFDLRSLERPPVPLGLINAAHDRWLVPRFHGERIAQACQPCERIADLPSAGHGALLSPLPPGLTGLVGELLNDPPGFDRAVLGDVDAKVSAFFTRHLLQ
ncbi:MAG TPA: dienelactone hydrolase family protein [Rhizobacter sp.]|nr:dienelactone hydrolase family protein [Rhizobacter sp.]